MSKMKNKIGIDKLKVGGAVYENTKEPAKIINKNFRKVFTEKSE